MSGILSSLLTILVIPLVALALEPVDPVSFCDRFVDEKDIESCQKRTSTENVDWYAGAVCDLQKEDAAFWKCWDSAKDRSFDPKALAKCGEVSDFSDEQRQSCLENLIDKNRQPASTPQPAPFQALPKIKKLK